jgi:Sulfotransferase family
VFIVGAARSGTTLVRSMLGAHPELAIPPESHFLGYLGHRYARRSWTPGIVSSVAADVARDTHFRSWGLDPGGAAARVVASQPGSLAETLGGFFSVYADSEGKRLWGDKTPHYVFILDQLRDLWPNLRVIHVIRDGRDVACSHLALAADGRRWVAPTAAAAAAWWQSAVSRGRAAGSELGDRYAEVRYEELVGRPQQTIAGLCDFLGIERDTSVVEYHDRVRMAQSDEFSRVREPLDPNARDWRRELTDRDIAAFESVAGQQLADCGYLLANVPTRRLRMLTSNLQARAYLGARGMRRGARRAGHRHAPAVTRTWARRRTDS